VCRCFREVFATSGAAFRWLGIDVGVNHDSRPLRNDRARRRHMKKIEAGRLGEYILLMCEVLRRRPNNDHVMHQLFSANKRRLKFNRSTEDFNRRRTVEKCHVTGNFDACAGNY
jgi:hypothetical protein